jgi:hypothetical protein
MLCGHICPIGPSLLSLAALDLQRTDVCPTALPVPMFQGQGTERWNTETNQAGRAVWRHPKPHAAAAAAAAGGDGGDGTPPPRGLYQYLPYEYWLFC